MTELWNETCKRRPLIVAHRAGAALAGENTIGALRAAAAAGADAIETDVRRTRDGTLVCVHDADLRRLCGDTRAVADLDLVTLRSLLPAVTTLSEALSASHPLGVLLDVKLMEERHLPQIIGEVVLANAVERTLLGLRDTGLISAAQDIMAEIAVLAFLEKPDSAPEARRAGASWFRLWQGDATADRAAAVRNAGMRLAVMVGQPRMTPRADYPPFPVGQVDRQGLERLRTIAPDAILLDDPRLATAGVFR
ncbi:MULTISPECIES: glycerophosphodiester phosphodiesterase family protein [unclassified Sinorhizobium]|uniref:glycerophosphodiester phosphodiesterase n=1 Tax=unclassified Sinorhizobium TaxID=2613772 RepID=UPI0024C34542|nr:MULTISPECIES: glycerophosphodiester phosphodiesterase family protein [unclassified Sinorhizobium]MDK1373225.1 glycerophosphodiester phosphodiesterase family protein [Sinorhizobium sp. 6-70]MDK1480817.1 glycerophosphodiester phosphodiesterase family protein [Sinorhizobium sp. 6-117]